MFRPLGSKIKRKFGEIERERFVKMRFCTIYCSSEFFTFLIIVTFQWKRYGKVWFYVQRIP